MALPPRPREIKPAQIGLKVWFPPKEKEIDDVELDVIAVHGIAEDPDETWVHEATETNWLKDESMLPGALKKARIMRFGYNSVWYGKKAVKQSLGTVAGALLLALKIKRKECQQRPIIFIGHCLGGLVIEQAYITAKLEPDLYPGIYESITGIVFLGTPHRGNVESQKAQKTQAAVFAAITQAKMQVQDNILSTLAQDNATLLNTVTQFSRDISNQTSPPMLHCFFEQVGCSAGKMAGVETDSEEEEFVVNESSGTFDHHPKGGLALDHFQINKFENEEDGNYEFVRETIIEMMEATKRILNGRGTKQARPSSTVPRQYVSASRLPFANEPNFAPRNGIMQKIEEKFGRAVKVALCGSSGSGKTHTAIEYAHMYSEAYPESRVFWVNANSTEQIKRSYKVISETLQLRDVGTNVLQAVYHYLKQDSSGYWLLVLDGIEDEGGDGADARKADKGGSKALLETTPTGFHGRVLITTRSMSIASRMVNQVEYVIEMPNLSNDDAAQLLLGEPTTDKVRMNSALKIADEVDRSPAALMLASAYREATGRDFSLNAYLQKLQSQTLQLEHQGKTEFGVARTWQLVYNLVNEKHSDAARLMLLIGVLDLQSTRAFILAKTVATPVQLDQQIGVLVSHGLVKRSVNRNDISMTRMIRLCVRAWLAAADKKVWAEEWALSTLLETYPAPESKEYATCEILHPCAVAVLGFQPASPHGKSLRAGLLFKMADYHKQLGESSVALQYLEECLALREEDPYKKAEQINEIKKALEEVRGEQQRAVTAPELVMPGAEGQNGPQSMATPARPKAELQELEKAKGGDHYDTVRKANDVAAALHRQDAGAEAVALRQRILKWCDAKYGPSHMDTIRQQYNLGLAYDVQGQYEQAVALYLSAFQAAEKHLGPGSPELLRILGSLGRVYCAQGKLDDASKALQVVLAGQQEQLGPDHPETLVSRLNAAMVVQELGHLEEAGTEMRGVLGAQVRLLGQENEATLRTASSLALNFRLRGQLREAEGLFRATLETQERALGKAHSDTLTTRLMLAELLQDMGKVPDARGVYQTVVDDGPKTWGEKHPETLYVKQKIQALA